MSQNDTHETAQDRTQATINRGLRAAQLLENEAFNDATSALAEQLMDRWRVHGSLTLVPSNTKRHYPYELKLEAATRHAAGPRAIEAYLEDPLASRLIMSIKSYLAQRSLMETRVFGRSYALDQLVGLLLNGIASLAALPAPA